MSRVPSTPRKSFRRNMRSAGFWLGPESGPDAATCILLVCHHCHSQSVTQPLYAVPTLITCEDLFERTAEGTLTIRHVEHACWYAARAYCQACKQQVNVRIFGRFSEPWTLGLGVVRPMPNYPEAEPDAGAAPPAEGAQP